MNRCKRIPLVSREMFKQLSLTLIAVAAAGLKACSYAVAGSLHTLMCVLWGIPQRQATGKNPPTALEGAKATALTAKHPPAIHSQAPGPINPRTLADRTDYCKYQYIPVGRLSFPPSRRFTTKADRILSYSTIDINLQPGPRPS